MARTAHDRRAFRAAATVAVAAAALSCSERSPTNPTSTVRTLIVTPSAAQLDIGRTVQLSATAQLADGTTTDVTTDCTWQTLQPEIASVSAGLVTALSGGAADIRAEYRGVTAATRVSVRGSFTLRGMVHETAPTVDKAIADASIEVTSSSGTRSVRSDAGGRFEVTGLTGGVTLRASKAGYDDTRLTFDAPAPGSEVDVALNPAFSERIQRDQGSFCRPTEASPTCPTGAHIQAHYFADVHHAGTFDIHLRLGWADYQEWLFAELRCNDVLTNQRRIHIDRWPIYLLPPLKNEHHVELPVSAGCRSELKFWVDLRGRPSIPFDLEIRHPS